MKNIYFLIINIFLSLTIISCTTNPVKKQPEKFSLEVAATDIVISTYECYEDPNLKENSDLRKMILEGKDLSGSLLNCSGHTVVVDTILEYGADQVNILDLSSGKWQTYNLKDCSLMSHQ